MIYGLCLLAGKQCFFIVRQQHFTIQALLFVGQSVSKQMVKFVSKYVTNLFMNVFLPLLVDFCGHFFISLMRMV